MDMKPRCVIKEVPTADPLAPLKVLVSPDVVYDLDLYLTAILQAGLRKLVKRVEMRPRAASAAVEAVCGKNAVYDEVSEECYDQAEVWWLETLKSLLAVVDRVAEDDFESREEEDATLDEMFAILRVVYLCLAD